MRISELSRRSGVPVATIKYYLREGLMPPGRSTAATQADYNQAHLRRLRLVRALSEVGGLSLASVRAILTAVDDPNLGLHEILGQTHHALAGDVGSATDDPDWPAARAEVDALLDELGWHVNTRAPARDQLARALLTLRRLDASPTNEELRPYASAAQTLAAHELALLATSAESDASVSDLVQRAVIGTVLYEPVLLALRRLAEEHESARRLHPPDQTLTPEQPCWPRT
ncbi:MAG: MerR family transcriptional regulator [Actinomycetota bacterium]|nr:MerR family transcriptional regulator [Actinomycetota bacterium]